MRSDFSLNSTIRTLGDEQDSILLYLYIGGCPIGNVLCSTANCGRAIMCCMYDHRLKQSIDQYDTSHLEE